MTKELLTRANWESLSKQFMYGFCVYTYKAYDRPNVQ